MARAVLSNRVLRRIDSASFYAMGERRGAAPVRSAQGVCLQKHTPWYILGGLIWGQLEAAAKGAGVVSTKKPAMTKPGNTQGGRWLWKNVVGGIVEVGSS